MSFDAGAIIGTIGIDTSPLRADIGRAEGMMRGLRSDTEGIFRGIGASIAGNLIGGLAASGVRRAFAGIVGGIGFGTSLAFEAEKSEVAFKTMLGSGDAARSLLADLNQFAAETPFDMPGLTDAARKLVAFGSAGDQVVPELRAIGDIAAGIDAPISEIAELYGKARVQGRLFGEDINQLVGRGIPIITELAKQFGVAEGEVKDLVASGEVNFSHMQKAFVSLTSEGGQFAGLMAEISQTSSGILGTVTDELGMMAKEIAQTVLEASDFKGLLGEFGEAIPVIKSITLAMLELGRGAVAEVFDWFGALTGVSTQSGNRILAAMEIGAKGIAFVADMLDVAVLGYKFLKLGATGFMAIAAHGVAELVRLATYLPDWLGGGVAADVSQIADAFASEMDREIQTIVADIDAALVEPSSGDQIMAFFKGVREQAEAAAKASQEIKPPQQLIIDAPDIAPGRSKDDQEKAEKLLAGLRFDLADIGLSDIEQRMADLRREGILSEDELKEARRLLEEIDAKTKVQAAVESIQSPLEAFDDRMDELQAWLDQGRITLDQFNELSSKAQTDAFGERRLAQLSMVGSAAEKALQFDQARGARAERPIEKQQLDQAKESTRHLSDLVGLFRQFTGGAGAVTEFIGI